MSPLKRHSRSRPQRGRTRLRSETGSVQNWRRRTLGWRESHIAARLYWNRAAPSGWCQRDMNRDLSQQSTKAQNDPEKQDAPEAELSPSDSAFVPCGETATFEFNSSRTQTTRRRQRHARHSGLGNLRYPAQYSRQRHLHLGRALPSCRPRNSALGELWPS